MASNTPNYNLVKPSYQDFADIEVLNGNADIVDTTLKYIDDKIDRYGVATGTNTLVLNLVKAPTSLYEGLEIKFKNTTANTGDVTINVNGLGVKPLLKNTGANIPSGGLKGNAFYSAFYDGSNFILQGEGGEYGTAQAHQVLSGYTIGTEIGIISGTMPDFRRSTIGPGYVTAVDASGDSGGSIVMTPQTGYYDDVKNAGDFGSIIANDPDYVPSNIVQGASIFGVSGTFERGLTSREGSSSIGPYTFIEITGIPFYPQIVYLNYQNVYIGIRVGGVYSYCGNHSGETIALYVETISANSFRVRNDTASTLPFNWKALGR